MKNNDTKNEFLRQGFFFFSTVNSTFQFILNIASELVEKNQEILQWIQQDQDKFCKEKKRLRILDRRFEENKTASLFYESDLKKICEAIDAEEIILNTGRPRMDPIIVFLFFIFRGYYGSFCKKHSLDLLMESTSIKIWLARYGIDELPGATTILENVNMISNETREKILTLQCSMVSEEELDDFETSIIDSTAVAGNTAYPTDVSILYKLISRSYLKLYKFCELFGLSTPKAYFKDWLPEMKSSVFVLEMGKLKNKEKRKVCKKLLKLAGKIENRLSKKHEQLQAEIELILSGLRPTLQMRFIKIWEGIKVDLEDSIKVSQYTRGGFLEGKKYKSKDKILSISDENVGYIKKGSLRSAVIGYKPQIVRSGNGIITAMKVSEGNTSDMKELIPVLKQDFRRTETISKTVNTDDGYSWNYNKNYLKRVGVEVISFNGINGRRLTSDEDWESEVYKAARANRSTIEGLISTLKLVHDFGKLRRRGIENGRAEMLEKVIAQNFYRIGILRKRRREKEREKAEEERYKKVA